MYKVLAIGEVLWDLLPAGKQLGGAPANFAYQCRSLGADARIVTRIGDDELGREVLDRFAELQLPTDTVEIDSTAPTGTVSVELDSDGQPRYTIHENVAWDRIEAGPLALARAAEADALCFGSLAQRNPSSRDAIARLVAASRPAALRIFDVNLRPPFIDREIIAGSLATANVLKLNDHELGVLAGMFGITGEPRQVIETLADRHELSLVAVTRGDRGSLLFAEGHWSENPGLVVKVVDSVGAGDAFTAALTMGLLAGRPLDEINARANAVAAFVCSRSGGTPVLPEALRSGF